MGSRLHGAAALLLLCSLSAPAAEPLDFKGHYKNLLVASRTVVGDPQGYALDLNRLRLELRQRPFTGLTYELRYDHEALLGSYLRTPQFALQQATAPRSYWDLDDEYVQRRTLRLRHRLYRGFLRLEAEGTSAQLGRQRIAWGSGRIWNPTDRLNPYDATQIESGERPGVDALLLEQAFDALSGASLVYAPQRAAADRWALRYRSHRAATDLALMGGRFGAARVLGGEFAGRIGAAGVYGEATFTRPDHGSSELRAVLGGDYAWANTLTLSLEAYWNGAGHHDPADYDLAALASGDIQNLGQRYLGLRLRYDITPLLRSENLAIANLDDGSAVLVPALLYSLRPDWDLGLGLQLYTGPEQSEYGRPAHLGLVYLQWFF